MISEGLRTLLLAQSSVTDLVGTRIYVTVARQGITQPYIVIDRVDNEKYKGLAGYLSAQHAEVDIECWASTQTAAAALAKIVSDYLDDFSGATGGSETITAVHQVGDVDNYATPQGGGEITEFVTILNFELDYTG